MSDAGLADSGAADRLPRLGATAEKQVSGAVALAQRDYPTASVRVGPGIGVTYTMTTDRKVTYHHRNDFQLWVRVPDSSQCPSNQAFVQGADGRIPVFAIFTR